MRLVIAAILMLLASPLQAQQVIGFDYETIREDALRSVAHDVMAHAADYGLPAENHFYITVKSNYPGVDLGPKLKKQYPHTITLAIQHEYTDLVVDEAGFAVTLVFNGVQQRVSVPFRAVVSFLDPSTGFQLDF